MTIEESLENIENNFKKFSENMDVFLDSFAESLYDLKKQYEDNQSLDAVEVEPSGLWKPKEGEEYWYIDSDSDVLNTNYYDECGFSIGNCFKTQEEAEKALERLKIRRQLKDIAERLNKGRKIDWSNAEDKYCLSLYFKEEITIRTQKYLKMQDAIYCLDKNFKDVAIAEIGEERLRNYLKEC